MKTTPTQLERKKYTN